MRSMAMYSALSTCATALAALSLVLSSLSAQAAVGVVTDVEGETSLVRDIEVFALEPGVDVDEGDLVQTGADARVQIEMDDGSLLEVGESSELYLTDYQLRDDNSVENATLSVVKGWLRFVAATLKPLSRYEFNTPTASIGIRGTEGVIESGEASSSLLLEEGRVEVFEVDDEGEAGASETVEAGEFVRRGRAKRIVRQNPEAFRAALPAHFEKRPQRLKKLLKRRGISPRKLREMGYDDVKRLLKTNPRIRNRFKDRLRKKLSDPKFRERIKNNIKNHPQWERELRRHLEKNPGKKGKIKQPRKDSPEYQRRLKKQKRKQSGSSLQHRDASRVSSSESVLLPKRSSNSRRSSRKKRKVATR